jgi:hypothetical protein
MDLTIQKYWIDDEYETDSDTTIIDNKGNEIESIDDVLEKFGVEADEFNDFIYDLI